MAATAGIPAVRNKDIYIIYILVVLYALCYQLQSPLEPFLVERLIGKDKGSDVSVQYGYLQSFFQVIQTVGSLSFGHFLDRFGVRAGFIVNFLGCALTYLILSQTSSIGMLYLSKLPGVAMAGFLVAQTGVSQATPSGPERVAALGRLTTAYTIGGIVGPFSGGLLGAKGDYFLSAKIAVVGSALAAGLSCFLSSNTKIEVSEAKASEAKATHKPWIDRVRLVGQLAGFLILVKLATSTANSIASSSQSLILKEELGFSEKDLGFFMSAQFAFGGFANGFLLAPLTSMLGGNARPVVRNCLVIMAAGYCLQAGLSSIDLGALRQYTFIGIAMLLSVAQYAMGTSITAESTQIVPDDMKGTLIGMEHSIFSGARIITPSIGTHILHLAGVTGLYSACSSIFLMVFVLWTTFSHNIAQKSQ